jgi:hypothetical protein
VWKILGVKVELCYASCPFCQPTLASHFIDNLTYCSIEIGNGYLIAGATRAHKLKPPGCEPGGGKFGLGIIERADEAVERTGAVLDAIEWKRSADLGNDPPTTGNAAILFHKVSPAARRSSDICRWCV